MMNDDIKTLIFTIIVITIIICFFIFLIGAVNERDKIIENSNCEQLTQIIKDRGNDLPPRHDTVMTKWVQKECWK